MDVEVVMACLKYCCSICLKGPGKANENVSLRILGAMDTIHSGHYRLNQTVR